jgi:hypothetical protein
VRLLPMVIPPPRRLLATNHRHLRVAALHCGLQRHDLAQVAAVIGVIGIDRTAKAGFHRLDCCGCIAQAKAHIVALLQVRSKLQRLGELIGGIQMKRADVILVSSQTCAIIASGQQHVTPCLEKETTRTRNL